MVSAIRGKIRRAEDETTRRRESARTRIGDCLQRTQTRTPRTIAERTSGWPRLRGPRIHQFRSNRRHQAAAPAPPAFGGKHRGRATRGVRCQYVAQARIGRQGPLDRASVSYGACLHEMRQRTTNTEQCACCTTLVDTLPKRNRPTAPKPVAPVTIRSASWLSATFRIWSAGLPIIGACSTR